MTLRKVFLSTVSAAALLAASHETAMAADADSGAADAGGLEEIVVTARKREENLLKVPVAITAITGEDLAKQGIKSFNQLIDNTPGINMTNLGGGGGRSDRSFQQITLRGFVPSTTLSTLTSTFIDGVPVASPTAVASVSDPARVEILKGPQAAYFGRNTFAGAINVINRQPGSEVGGSLSLLGGTRGNLDFAGALSGPLGDRLGFRLAGKYFTKDGSYGNAAVTNGRLGDQRTRSLNLLLTAKITDNFSAKIFGLYSEDKDGAPVQGLASAYEVRAVNGLTSVPAQGGSTGGTVIIPSSSNCTISGFRFGDGRPLGPLPTDNAVVARPWICGAVPSLNSALTPAQNAVPASLLTAPIANGAQRVLSPGEGAQGYGLVRKYTHAHLNLDYQFGDSGFTLTSLTGLNAEQWSEIADLDNFDSRLLNNPNATSVANVAQGTPLNSYWDFVFGVERETYDFSQELRLAYDKKGPFTGVLGVSMIDTTVWNNLVNYSNEVMAVRSSAVSPTAVLVSGHTSVGKSPVKNKGIFFGATYAFTDALKLSVEGRYQEDRVIGLTSSSPAGTTVSAAGAAAFNIKAGFYGPLTTLIEAKYKNFLPRAIVQYNINPDVMAYASYSKGVNVGTNTFNTTFLAQSAQSIQVASELGLTVAQKPEKLVNYEIGLKGKFLDNRLQLQGAAYYAIWSDQLNSRSRTFLDNGPDGIGTAQQVAGLANTGETALKGLEVEIKAAPIDHVELNFAAAMTDSSIRSFATPGVTQYSGLIGDQFKGKQLPLSSKYSLNLGGMYSNTLNAWPDGSWFARADVSWKDKQFADATNITWIKARTVVNLRAGVVKGPLSVEAYVLNAFNDKNFTGVITGTVLTPTFSLTGATSSMLLQLPDLRTAGLQVAYKF